MTRTQQRLVAVVQHRHFILVCIVAATTVRILWIAFVHPAQVSDFKWYYDRAASIAGGQGYAVNGIPTAYWPVGYPGFLGILFYFFGASPFTGQIANVLLSVATILLSYRLSKQIFNSEIAARITVLLMSFHLNQIAFNSLLCSEVWFTFLLMLGAVLFIAARRRLLFLACSGLCWGLGTLTKPQLIFLPLIFLLVFYGNKINFLKSAMIVYSLLALCLIPWALRNQKALGHPVLSTNGGIVLMQGNNPYATGTHIWNDNLAALLGEKPESGQEDQHVGPSEVARAQRARQVGTAYIAQHPGRTVALWPKKLMYAYRSDTDALFYSMGMMQPMARGLTFTYTGLRILAELYYVLMLVLAAISYHAVSKDSPKEYKLGLYVIFYFSAICVLFIAIARYHYPLMPWIAIYSGLGASVLLGAWSKRSMAPVNDTGAAGGPAI
ncbi:MAG: glycosyltransferase family 39 protein [Acidobacteriota bacterium]|nr:glycosyltransferase family 39 protein [Acidobacteriota bacterium]